MKTETKTPAAKVGPTPAEIRAMPLIEFNALFGWFPSSAIEKAYFADTGTQPSSECLMMIWQGMLTVNLDGVVMTNEAEAAAP